jgi:hypothetical protein
LAQKRSWKQFEDRTTQSVSQSDPWTIFCDRAQSVDLRNNKLPSVFNLSPTIAFSKHNACDNYVCYCKTIPGIATTSFAFSASSRSFTRPQYIYIDRSCASQTQVLRLVTISPHAELKSQPMTITPVQPCRPFVLQDNVLPLLTSFHRLQIAPTRQRRERFLLLLVTTSPKHLPVTSSQLRTMLSLQPIP